MIPLSLRLRNFMSYGEHVPPLDFTPITTACLTGDNGHGKSALLDAITWALWGQTRAKSIDDIVRLGQDECEVEFAFDLEGDRYRVLRKRSLRTRSGLSALELHGFDPATRSYRALSGNSIRETEAKIAHILHMNYDTFVNSVFILQGRADEFTTRRPGERKRILSEILGLSVFDELQTRARIHHGSLDQEAKTIAERLHELQQQVARKVDLAASVEGSPGNADRLAGRGARSPGKPGDLAATPERPGIAATTAPGRVSTLAATPAGTGRPGAAIGPAPAAPRRL